MTEALAKLSARVDAEQLFRHRMGEWGSVGGIPRATCQRCGRAVLVNPHGFAYGPAVKERCDKEQDSERHGGLDYGEFGKSA